MNRSQIDKILTQRGIPDPCEDPILVETHISWVILGDERAFKIKKPVKFPFLDFSTLNRRRYYCRRELLLNSRLTQGIYLKTMPIRTAGDRVWIGKPEDGEVIDCALVMSRMDTDKEMDRMLKADKVELHHVKQLAEVISRFHQETQVISQGFGSETLKKEFNGIRDLVSYANAHGQPWMESLIVEAIRVSDSFLERHKQRLRERIQDGFVRDCHGDLHSGNIFLYDPPVIFDCIEFNDEFRQIDVLSEVAFLAMDLEFHGRIDLAKDFMEAYLKAFPAIVIPEDEGLFNYYKLYRANVRAKVHLLKAGQGKHADAVEAQMSLAARYGRLMEQYMNQLIPSQT